VGQQLLKYQALQTALAKPFQVGSPGSHHDLVRFDSREAVGHASPAQEAFKQGRFHVGSEFELFLDHTPNVGMVTTGHRSFFPGHPVYRAGGLAKAAPITPGNLIIDREELCYCFHLYLHIESEVKLARQALRLTI
jgi:hypothetical protein